MENSHEPIVLTRDELRELTLRSRSGVEICRRTVSDQTRRQSYRLSGDAL